MLHDMPRIYIAPTTHKQLKRIVGDAYNAKERTATFLDAELRRATIAESLPDHVVTPGSLVRYQLDWGPFSPVRKLVYPNEFTCEATQISLLSQIGIALIGMRRGDTMPVFIPDEGFRILHVATVVHPETEPENSPQYKDIRK
jgi:regulator of nucleoside diphosphate kinase